MRPQVGLISTSLSTPTPWLAKGVGGPGVTLRSDQFPPPPQGYNHGARPKLIPGVRGRESWQATSQSQKEVTA